MSHSHLITTISASVTECMKTHDPSHNPAHIQRVVNLALKILKSEQSRPQPESEPISQQSRPIDELTVHLAALLHDISDRKYLPGVPSEKDEGSSSGFESVPPHELVSHILLSRGADEDLAHRVQAIVSRVSYTAERKDPEAVRRLIEDEGCVELAIVQDADRLDALGAVGIGRCFTFLGAKGRDVLKDGEEWEMENSIRHFGEKLERLQGMMKTGTGREMARVRTQRLRVFKSWWEEEMEENSV